jgi:hypothetical protein
LRAGLAPSRYKGVQILPGADGWLPVNFKVVLGMVVWLCRFGRVDEEFVSYGSRFVSDVSPLVLVGRGSIEYGECNYNGVTVSLR